ncbi:MalY/PatB family protein [Actinoplanes subtropicus]|uniref:MalY/PatB family protein n=1 Tax=Actinoplanes subtropicus TaxID=543632 RepID=UPI0004C3D9AF|nr:aminotransferase class I/II-fold pyridoxal phosphate-dependent enzyme [Actinoplanes subtropicus]
MTSVPNPLRQLTLDRLRERTSEKWRHYPADVVPAFVAEMDVPLAEPVVRAITEVARRGDTGYPAGDGYAEALADFARKRWGWDGPAVERSTMVPDVMHGILEILDVLSARTDAVVVNCPVYPPFYHFVRHTGRPIEEAPLFTDGRLDLVALRQAFRRAAARSARPVFLLCNPHNPTGAVHTAQELTAVAEMAERHGVRVVADEIHAPLVLPGAVFTPYLSVPGAENGFSVLSASKAWNLAGLKAAVAVAGPAATEDLVRLPFWVKEGPSHVGVLAHIAALRDATDWLDALLAGLDENRRLLTGLVAERLPGVVYHPGGGTYLAWLDCRALDLGDDPAAVFLERGRVALSSGPSFGTGGAGHARLNFGTSPELLTEAVARMATALGG